MMTSPRVADNDRSSPAAAAAEAPALRAAVSALPTYVAGRRSDSALTAALAANESHFRPLPSVLEVVEAATHHLNRYPDPASMRLRQKLAEHLKVDVDEVVVGPGSAGVLQQIITSVCDQGDEVVLAWRSFEAYPILISIAGARAVPIPLHSGEGHDLPAMAAAITDRTRLVILCSPNNPTGVSIRPDALDTFLNTVPRRVLVVVDEAYIEYSTSHDAIDSVALFRQHPNLCVLRTFSKAYGLAGLRVGYAIASASIAGGLRRTATPFAVSTVGQAAAVASLVATAEMRDRVDSLVAERFRVTQAIRRFGWMLQDSEANFIWLRTTGELRIALLDAFTAADILVRAYTGDGDGVRITLADPETNDRVLQVLSDRDSFPAQR